MEVHEVNRCPKTFNSTRYSLRHYIINCQKSKKNGILKGVRKETLLTRGSHNWISEHKPDRLGESGIT